MGIASAARRVATVGMLILLAACGGDGGVDVGNAQPPPAAGIGAAGGTVQGPNGASVVVPPGALATNVVIEIAQTSTGSPPLPSGFSVLGQMFAFTPHGTTFAVPVTVTLPFSGTGVSAGRTPVLYKTNAQNQWEPVASATFGAQSVAATFSSFSFAAVLVPDLVRGEPIREWSFSEFRGRALEEVEVDSDIQVGGVLHELFDFGPTSRDGDIIDPDGSSLPSDGIATGQVASLPSGATFWVGAEAPGGNANVPEAPIGSLTGLKQTQSFIKRAADARLTLTVSAAFIETMDKNAIFNRPCPPDLADGLICDFIKGEVFFWTEAFTVPPAPNITTFRTFFGMAGGATVQGHAENWNGETWTPRYSFNGPLWSVEDFDFVVDQQDGTPDALVLMTLRAPRRITVDLSSVAVGEAFTLQTYLYAKAYNRIAGPPSEFGTSAGAFLRDPQDIGGATLEFSGLEETNDVAQRPVQVEAPAAPLACTTQPPDPAAGTLQFGAPAFAVSEADTTPAVIVTRTGSSSGAVSATFATSNGTAIADTDYRATNVSVFFADGDVSPRVVEIPIVQDNLAREPDKTVNLTLSQPGGCAALGAQANAVLTIRDDDPAPPLPPGVFLDPDFGAEGLATSPGFGGDRSAMARQADGKFVIVGGTFTDFILARFNANGTLDASFDGDGKVTTDMVPGEQEEALGVAIQSDGKIVVAGYTGTPGPANGANFALARYNADGTPDLSFGTVGKVTSGVSGRAYAVAIQPDGRIVAVGDVDVASGNDFGNFVVARFNADGTPDNSFSGDGQVVTDIGGATNTARNVVLQPNGSILVSGEPFGTFAGSERTDVVRYTASGALDAGFGTAGTLTIAGTRVGEGLALQSDGRFVLVGQIDASIPPATPGTATNFAVMRRNADGSPDPGFGAAGLASTPISGQRDAALAVTLQPDGKIVVAGRSSNSNVNFAVARYNTNGTLDTTFGRDSSGTLAIDFFLFTDIAESVVVQPDGQIVLGGATRDNVDAYGLARIAQ